MTANLSDRQRGRVLLWQGGSLWIGRSTGTTDTHDHHAVQIAIALDGQLLLRTPADADWRAYHGAIIPSHQPHAFSTTNAVVANIFIEPEAHEGKSLLERFAPQAIVELPAALAHDVHAALSSAYGDAASDEDLVAAAHEAVRILTAGTAPRSVVDPRILKAIDVVQDRLEGHVSQQEIAEIVFLSPSRFRHLFVQETGMAFRPYVLWLRLQRALERYSEGDSLTTAAHAAGFSDLAHLSRTFRRMFGIAPATLGQIHAYGPSRSRSR